MSSRLTREVTVTPTMRAVWLGIAHAALVFGVMVVGAAIYINALSGVQSLVVLSLGYLVGLVLVTFMMRKTLRSVNTLTATMASTGCYIAASALVITSAMESFKATSGTGGETLATLWLVVVPIVHLLWMMHALKRS